MKNCAIVGINWGDEGKGRMVDLLTEGYDVVVRYQGGGNAGHTVVNEKGKFALHLLPSGIFRDGVVNVLGNGVALDPENLWKEMQEVSSKGIEITPENLKISDRASLLMPWHRDMDALEEQRLADKKYGSTRQGIAPFYSDKYQKKTILAGELFYPEELEGHLEAILEWKDLTLTRVYGAKAYTMEEIKSWLSDYCDKIKPFICDTGEFLRDAQEQGKNFVVMYGAAEATSRMGYLPPERAVEKKGSMGIPIPGGTFRLVDADDREITEPHVTGELVYEGKNVTLGYAVCGEDLIKGDERGGVLKTGDMAQFDEDHFYYIVGHKKRFLKIYGNRVNLDEIDRMIKGQFNIEVASDGVDDHMYIFVTDGNLSDEVREFVIAKTKLNLAAFKVIVIDEIPKNESGKTLYKELKKYYAE